MWAIRNRIIPFGKSFVAINLFGVIFYKGSCDSVTFSHERIHSAQQRELAFVFFYIIYVLEWLVRLLCCLSWLKAYRSISFEREAYANQADGTYLQRRQRYSSFKYLFNRNFPPLGR